MADVDVKVSEREDSAATCVFCRETLGAAAVTCEGCGVGLHAGCRDELRKCPTLGCAQSWQRRGRVRLADETARTAEPLPGFRPIGVTDDGEGPPGWVIAAFVVVCLIVIGLVVATSSPHASDGAPASVVRARERTAERVEAGRLAEQQSARAEAEALRSAAESVAATPLSVTRDEEAVWRTGTLEVFGASISASQEPTPGVLLMKSLSSTDHANGLSVEEARWLQASARQRALAALPPAAADAWARHGVGSSAHVNVDFDLLPSNYTDYSPVHGHRASLEATITLLAIHPDSIELRVTVLYAPTPVSWLETWPRAVAPKLRSSVLTIADTPASTLVVQGATRQGRAVTANADGVTVQVFQEDGLPLPWRASVLRGRDGAMSRRVTVELLDFTPAAR